FEPAFAVAAHRGGGELGEAKAQVDVGAWIVDKPAVAVAVRRVVELDAAEDEAAVVRRIGGHARTAESEEPAAPLGGCIRGEGDHGQHDHPKSAGACQHVIRQYMHSRSEMARRERKGWI